jgi:phosphatidylserine/phosphatidylglycerophosphate/cardiolipin synthase-like enzyme
MSSSLPKTGGRSRVGLLSLMTVVAFAVFLYLQVRSRPEVHVSAEANGAVHSENHFAPAEDLERFDVQEINRAQRTIDIAMYAFTDRYIAEALIRAAHRGVAIRLYRDREQYHEEQRHAAEHGGMSTTSIFRGEPLIHIRVKRNGERNLMHLKGYVIDGGLLRDGSANWSNAGLKDQDNNAHFTNDRAEVRAYMEDFERMWRRGDNEEIQ